MTRRAPLILPLALIALLAACGSSPGAPIDGGGAEVSGPNDRFEGTYRMEYGAPAVVTATGFPPPVEASLEEFDGTLWLNLNWDVAAPDSDFRPGQGIGLTVEFAMYCEPDGSCSVAGGVPGTPAFTADTTAWTPVLSPQNDVYYEGCPADERADREVRDIVEADGLVDSFTVDLFWHFNDSYDGSTSGGCAAFALVEVEATATRIE